MNQNNYSERPILLVEDNPMDIDLTLRAFRKDIKTAYQYGANSYIVKPVDFDKFAAVAAEINLYWIGTTILPR